MNREARGNRIFKDDEGRNCFLQNVWRSLSEVGMAAEGGDCQAVRERATMILKWVAAALRMGN
jgi:hypothetical protein